MTEAEQKQAHKARRERWGMASNKTNVLMEERRRLEAHRKAERMAWEEQQRVKQQEVKRREFIASIGNIGTHAELAASFSEYQNPVSVQISGKYVRRTMPEIAKEVLKSFPGVSLAQVQGIQRQHNIMMARRHVIATIRMERPDLSMPMIGRFVKKDHTSVLHAIREFQADILQRAAAE